MPRGRPKTTTARQTVIDLMNGIGLAFDQMLTEVEGNPEAFNPNEIATMEAYVVHRMGETGRKLRLLIAKDVRGSATFDFGMTLPADAVVAAPQSLAQPILAIAAPAVAVARLASAGGVVTPEKPANAVPVGRMVGTKDVVLAEPEILTPTPAPADAAEIDFIDA